jgi:hypothetical protein
MTPRRRYSSGFLGSGIALAALIASSTAHADVSSWLALGGGVSAQADSVTKTFDKQPLFTASIGVGTTSQSPLVVGGTLRTVTHFNLGTDIALGPRFATGGFARGDFGLAVDVGLVGRFWKGGFYGEWPVQGVLTLGAPFGLQLAAGAQVFSVTGTEPFGRGGFVALELDVLRLTVMRRGSSEALWPNPSPAAQAAAGVGSF